MLNTNTYFGSDAVLTLADPAGIEGEEFAGYFGEDGVVGRLLNVTLQTQVAIKPFYELGSRAPKELRAGNFRISGTVERAYINGAMLKLLLGQYAADQEGPTPFAPPTFNMKITLDNLKPEGEEGNNVLSVYGVMFDSWQFNLPEDDFVLEQLSFQAQRLTTEDKPIPES